MGDQFVLDVPVGLSDHVGEEDGFDFVHQKNLGDGFEHFVDWVFEGNGAASGDGPQDRHNIPQLTAAVCVECLAVFGGNVSISVFSAHHKNDKLINSP